MDLKVITGDINETTDRRAKLSERDSIITVVTNTHIYIYIYIYIQL